jgi:hypothetical protein
MCYKDGKGNANGPTECQMKMTVFWVVAPFSLVRDYQCFRGTCCLHQPDDGGSKYFRNVGKRLPAYMVLQPRRQSSSYSAIRISNPTECQDDIHLHLLKKATKSDYSVKSQV